MDELRGRLARVGGERDEGRERADRAEERAEEMAERVGVLEKENDALRERLEGLAETFDQVRACRSPSCLKMVLMKHESSARPCFCPRRVPGFRLCGVAVPSTGPSRPRPSPQWPLFACSSGYVDD